MVLVQHTQTSELKSDNRTVQKENAEYILCMWFKHDPECS